MVPVKPKPLPKPKPVVAPKPTPAPVPIPAVVDPVPAIAPTPVLAPIIPDPVPATPFAPPVASIADSSPTPSPSPAWSPWSDVDEFNKSLTQKQKDALQDYVGDSRMVNDPLRRGTPLRSVDAELIDDLDNIFAKAPVIPKGTKVYRVIDEDDFESFYSGKTEWVDKGFVSTSSTAAARDALIDELAEMNLKPVVLEIEMGEGMSGLPLWAQGDGYFAYQKEVLLPRGRRFVFLGKEGGVVKLRVEVDDAAVIPAPIVPDAPSTPVAPLDLPEEPVSGLAVAHPSLPDVDAAAKSLKAIRLRASTDEIQSALQDLTLSRIGLDISADEAAEKIEQAINNADVYMCMKHSVLAKCIKENKFKNSLETGKGTFKSAGIERVNTIERPVLGVTAPLEETDSFPKYGFLSSKNEMSYEDIVDFGYGDTYVQFKRSNLEGRTTVTYGDSYNSNAYPQQRVSPAMRLDKPNGKDALMHLEGRGYGTWKPEDRSKITAKIRSGDIDQISSITEYTEAQIYGQVTLSDVKTVYSASKKEILSIKNSLKKSYPDIDVKPLKFDVRIQQIESRVISSKFKYSLDSDDIDRMGDYLIDRLNILDPFILRKYSDDRPDKWLWPKVTDNAPPDVKDILTRMGESSSAKNEPATFTISEKRIALKWFYGEMAKGKSGPVDTVFFEDYRPSLVGWTADVANEELLKKGLAL
jgi:hypothetical protein